MGVFESAPGIFLLLITVRWFQGSAFDKSILAASVHAGLLIAPIVIFTQRRFRLSAPHCMHILLIASAALMSLAGVVTQKHYFTLLAAVAILLQSAATPLLTSIYSENIPATSRGRYFSQCGVIRGVSSVIFATVAGWCLSGRLHLYPVLIAVYAAALLLASALLKRVPGAPRAPQVVASPLACFSHLRSDRVLRETIIAWNLLGFGNLMMIPLRVEYLANGRYGLSLSEVEIALLISTIPNTARLLSIGMWGRVFDKMNFFSLRMLLNFSFAIGTLSFFATNSWALLLCSAVLLGCTAAGGEVAWNLGVTKFTTPDKVPDYMAVHTFFTGLRGVVAPGVGFFLLQYLSPQSLSWICAALIFSSIFVLVRIQKS